jgi:putative SOS response-associated peptidase YedK
MCGRITLTVGQIERALESLPFKCSIDMLEPYRPSYNVAPTHLHPILFNDGKGAVVCEAHWGLIPPWDQEMKKFFINARAETLKEKQTFRDAFLKRRCIVPVDGFYEWRLEGKEKRPYWFHIGGNEVFYLAGIYNEKPKRSFAVLTTTATEWMTPYHHRMPVVLNAEMATKWISRAPTMVAEIDELLKETLAQSAALQLEARPVSNYVNTPDHNDPGCLDLRTESS